MKLPLVKPKSMGNVTSLRFPRAALNGLDCKPPHLRNVMENVFTQFSCETEQVTSPVEGEF